MSTASRGRALEHEIRELFRENGWSVVRGAGSKGEFADWKCDLVASRVTADNERKVYLAVVLAQCKLKGRKKRKCIMQSITRPGEQSTPTTTKPGQSSPGKSSQIGGSAHPAREKIEPCE